MRLLVINPNTSLAITAGIEAAARAAASPGTAILALPATRGPEEIATPEQSRAQAEVVVEMLAASHGADAAIIAAFSDPGLEAARARHTLPVFGIGESTFRAASAWGRYVLIVPNPASEAGYREIAERHGAAAGLLGMRFVYPRLHGRPKSAELLFTITLELAREALREAPAEAVAVGGGPMAAIAPRLAAALPVPVIEGVAAAVRLAERHAGRVSVAAHPT